MEKVSFVRQWKLYAALAVVLLLSLVVMPEGGSFDYTYEKGQLWPYETLLAPIDFPILKTDKEMMEEREKKAESVIPYYDCDEEVWNAKQRELATLSLEKQYDERILSALNEALQYVYQAGIVPTQIEDGEDGVVFVQKNKEAEERSAASLFTVTSAVKYVKTAVLASKKNIPDSVIQSLAIPALVSSNLSYNQTKALQLQKSEIDDVSPTKGIFYAGQVIVSAGEMVTEETERILDSLKAESSTALGDSRGGFLRTLGLMGGVASILVLLMVVIYLSDLRYKYKWSDMFFILTLFLLVYFSAAAVSTMPVKYLCMIPFPVCALYLKTFYGKRLAFGVYSVILLVLLETPAGASAYVINLFAGVTALMVSRYFSRGWLQFVNALFVFVAYIAVFSAAYLLEFGSLGDYPVWMFKSFAISSLGMVFLYPLSMLFEKVFSLVSDSRLNDLADTNNKLLRELAQTAPGTFQHSLQVSNLAGAAAKEIDANQMLVRVGALYHDIGKMRNPQCFVENEASGMDFHKSLSPADSALQIIRHVDDGIAIAKKHSLPEPVIAFIRSHHARTIAAYFYAEWCKSGGDPDNKAPFTYHGDLPQTKEEVILMMADSIEAASRTLKDYSVEHISQMVDSIIRSRMDGMQLAEADISVRDISKLREFFVNCISQMYHPRISYPKQ